jgi:hypothetical protein
MDAVDGGNLQVHWSQTDNEDENETTWGKNATSFKLYGLSFKAA